MEVEQNRYLATMAKKKKKRPRIRKIKQSDLGKVVIDCHVGEGLSGRGGVNPRSKKKIEKQ